MSADVVHQRDIVNILSQLEDDVTSTQKMLKRNPGKKDILIKDLNKIVLNADRDLRLKTQAIVRNRLAHSALLPFGAKSIEEEIPIPEQTPKPSFNLPPLQVKKQINLRETSTAIMPITPPINKTNMTASVQRSRTRQVRTAPPQILPKYNKHDPFEPKPSIPTDKVLLFGINRLVESKLMAEQDIKPLLDDVLKVEPCKGDIIILSRENDQRFVLDKNTDNRIGDTPIDNRIIESARENIVNEEKEDKKEQKFLFWLKYGKPIQTSVEFLFFKREFSSTWEKVEIILSLLYGICEDYGLKNSQVDGKLIVELTKLDPDSVSREKLIKCFLDKRKIMKMKLVTKVGFGFIGPHAEDKAATVIQSIWRGFYARRLIRLIRRNNAASRIIQRWFRNITNYIKFKNQVKAEKKRRMLMFEANQSNIENLWNDHPHTYIHLVNGHIGSEIGRVSVLLENNASLIIFTRSPVPFTIIEPLRQKHNSERLQFIHTQLKLPENIPIEDVLACDTRSLARIKLLLANQVPIIQPSRFKESLIEIAIKLNAYSLAPIESRMMMFHTHEAIRRLLISSKLRVFEGSDEVFDRTNLCKCLTDLSVSYLKIQQWRIRVRTGIIGWVNTNDFVLLERMKNHSDVLEENDLEDENFKQLLTQSLTNDLNIIVESTGNTSKTDFLKEVWMNGALIEAGPMQVISQPCVAFEVPAVGSSKIVGTWETLFTSLYEPFASIHPAFTVNRDKLKKKTLRVANECSSKRIVGSNILKYWYSTRYLSNSLNEERVKLTLTADDLIISHYEDMLPQLITNKVLERNFDEESMSMGPNIYTYVQNECIMPSQVEFDEMKMKCKGQNIPVDSKVYFFSDLKNSSVFSLVCVEESPEKLITLAYRVMTTLADSVFEISLKKDPSSNLLSYCHALEYLTIQLENSSVLTSTALMTKVKVRDMKSTKQNIMLKFVQEEKEDEEMLAQIPEVQETDRSTSREINSPIKETRSGNALQKVRSVSKV